MNEIGNNLDEEEEKVACMVVEVEGPSTAINGFDTILEDIT